MRVVLTGGGTGGHIYPALSVARLLTRDEVLFVGTAEGPEARIVPSAGVAFRSIPSRKLSRRPSPGAVAALAVCGWGVVRAVGLLREWRPDVVLGTGGYASAAVMTAAALLRIPTVVHEANVVPGRTNRLLSRFCTRVATTYAGSDRYFPAGKTVQTGLPIRPELLRGDPERARREYGLDPEVPTLFIYGGSGGAQTLNRAVIECLPQLLALPARVVHQTGTALFEEVRNETAGTPPAYRPVSYIDDVASLMSATTLIVCRAGSSTLAEVTAVGLPVIAVPYPYAVGDHQTLNARALEEAGAAMLIRDAECSGERLFREVSALLGAPERLEAMRRASRALGKPQAAENVVELLREQARPARQRGRGRARMNAG